MPKFEIWGARWPGSEALGLGPQECSLKAVVEAESFEEACRIWASSRLPGLLKVENGQIIYSEVHLFDNEKDARAWNQEST